MISPARTNGDSGDVESSPLVSLKPEFPKRETDLAMTLYRIETYQYRTMLAVEAIAAVVRTLKLPSWLVSSSELRTKKELRNG